MYPFRMTKNLLIKKIIKYYQRTHLSIRAIAKACNSSKVEIWHSKDSLWIYHNGEQIGFWIKSENKKILTNKGKPKMYQNLEVENIGFHIISTDDFKPIKELNFQILTLVK